VRNESHCYHNTLLTIVDFSSDMTKCCIYGLGVKGLICRGQEKRSRVLIAGGKNHVDMAVPASLSHKHSLEGSDEQGRVTSSTGNHVKASHGKDSDVTGTEYVVDRAIGAAGDDGGNKWWSGDVEVNLGRSGVKVRGYHTAGLWELKKCHLDTTSSNASGIPTPKNVIKKAMLLPMTPGQLFLSARTTAPSLPPPPKLGASV
jgi:hypothetical protein